MKLRAVLGIISGHFLSRQRMGFDAEIPLVDIGANLTSEMYCGQYFGRKSHESDLAAVLQRASEIGVEKVSLVSLLLMSS